MWLSERASRVRCDRTLIFPASHNAIGRRSVNEFPGRYIKYLPGKYCDVYHTTDSRTFCDYTCLSIEQIGRIPGLDV